MVVNAAGGSQKTEYSLIERVKLHSDLTAIIKLRYTHMEEKRTGVTAPKTGHVLCNEAGRHNKSMRGRVIGDMVKISSVGK